MSQPIRLRDTAKVGWEKYMQKRKAQNCKQAACAVVMRSNSGQNITEVYMAVYASSDMSSLNLSTYAENLSLPAKVRYVDKLNGMHVHSYQFPDPYIIPNCEWGEDINLWPHVLFDDIYAYLKTYNNNVFDEETLKNYKSLSAYEYVTSDKVQQVKMFKRNSEFCLFIAEVQRSQSLNKESHHPWAIVRENGSVITAHCTCMAGLGEACSHIAALLFKVEFAGSLKKNGLTPTDVACKWNNSFSSKKVECTRVENLEFSKFNWKTQSEGRKWKMLKFLNLPSFNEEEAAKLQEACPDAVIMSQLDISSSTDTASEDFEEEMPPNLIKAVKMVSGSKDIKQKLMEIFTSEKCDILQQNTTEQYLCPLWFEHRRGRFTSSNFKTILHRKQWSQVFISKLLCTDRKISSPALQWGRNNESIAMEAYIGQMTCQHANFRIQKCGLFINPQMPYLGASPDGLCICDCCGMGIIEIKCPFKHKDEVIKNIPSKDKMFCLDINGSLKINHAYFYQVQGQLAITGKPYCDFIIWTKVDTYVQRILPLPEFWKEKEEALEEAFYSQMLPVLQQVPVDN